MKFSSKIIWNLIRISFGCVFIFSSITKLVDISTFSLALEKFHLINNSLVPFFSYLIPVVELSLGVLITLNIKTEVPAQLATFLIALFTAVVISKLFEGEKISCGCFGNLTKQSIDYTTIIRNIILLIWGMGLAVYYQKKSYNYEKENSLPRKRLDKLFNSYWWKNLKTTFILILFFFLSVQVLIFAFQNRELKNRISLLTTDKDVLQPKDKAQQFSAIALDGNNIEFSFGSTGEKSLIYILSPRCESCKLNLPNWISLTNTIRNKNLKIIGISTDSIKATKEYSVKNQLNFSVFSATNDDFKIKYKAFITPQTILIDEHGLVIKVWPGILNVFYMKELTDKI